MPLPEVGGERVGVGAVEVSMMVTELSGDEEGEFAEEVKESTAVESTTDGTPDETGELEEAAAAEADDGDEPPVSIDMRSSSPKREFEVLQQA